LRNVVFFEKLSFDSMEEVTYYVQVDHHTAGSQIYKAENKCDKILILDNGIVDLNLTVSDQTLFLDSLRSRGDVLG